MTWDSVFRFRFSEKNMGLTLILMLQLVFVVYFRCDRFGAESTDSALNISSGKLDTTNCHTEYFRWRQTSSFIEINDFL